MRTVPGRLIILINVALACFFWLSSSLDFALSWSLEVLPLPLLLLLLFLLLLHVAGVIMAVDGHCICSCRRAS